MGSVFLSEMLAEEEGRWEIFPFPVVVLLIVPPSRLRSGPSMVHVTVRLGRESVVIHLAEWCILSLLMDV